MSDSTDLLVVRKYLLFQLVQRDSKRASPHHDSILLPLDGATLFLIISQSIEMTDDFAQVVFDTPRAR